VTGGIFWSTLVGGEPSAGAEVAGEARAASNSLDCTVRESSKR
jgi:hypothetical protein